MSYDGMVHTITRNEIDMINLQEALKTKRNEIDMIHTITRNEIDMIHLQ